MSDKEYVIRKLVKVVNEKELHSFSEEQILDLLLRKCEAFVLNEGVINPKYEVGLEHKGNVLFYELREYISGWKPEILDKYKLLLE